MSQAGGRVTRGRWAREIIGVVAGARETRQARALQAVRASYRYVRSLYRPTSREERQNRDTAALHEDPGWLAGRWMLAAPCSPGVVLPPKIRYSARARQPRRPDPRHRRPRRPCFSRAPRQRRRGGAKGRREGRWAWAALGSLVPVRGASHHWPWPSLVADAYATRVLPHDREHGKIDCAPSRTSTLHARKTGSGHCGH